MTVPPDDTSDDLWPRSVELPGARILSIRPVKPSDTAGLVELYAGLSEDDTYLRFFSGHAPPEDFIEKMTHVADRGGFGLIALMGERDGSSQIVGEATYDLLPSGDGELGLTVAETARGWLGPYLLDALVTEAATRGVPNLEADVLVGNRRMLTMLRARGFAVMDHDPAIVRVAIGAAQHVPAWPGAHDRPRLLLEVPGAAGTPKRQHERRDFRCWPVPDPSRAGQPVPPCAASPVPWWSAPTSSSTPSRTKRDVCCLSHTVERARQCPSASCSRPEREKSTQRSRKYRVTRAMRWSSASWSAW